MSSSLCSAEMLLRFMLLLTGVCEEDALSFAGVVCDSIAVVNVLCMCLSSIVVV